MNIAIVEGAKMTAKPLMTPKNAPQAGPYKIAPKVISPYSAILFVALDLPNFIFKYLSLLFLADSRFH